MCVIEEEDEDEMEKMLNELTHISPPSSALLQDSLHSEGGSQSGSSLDSLALMKKRLLDTTESDGTSVEHKVEGEENSTDEVSSPASISIEPPTPTTPSQQKSLAEGDRTSPSTMGSLLGDGLRLGLSEDDLLPSTSDPASCTNKTKDSTSPIKKSPFFSPASLQNSPSSSDMVRVALNRTMSRWVCGDVISFPPRLVTGHTDWKVV